MSPRVKVLIAIAVGLMAGSSHAQLPSPIRSTASPQEPPRSGAIPRHATRDRSSWSKNSSATSSNARKSHTRCAPEARRSTPNTTTSRAVYSRTEPGKSL